MSEVTLSREKFDALIFDLDGVLTRTAQVHASAWKVLFDRYLERLSQRTGKAYAPFDIEGDYNRYVDGKPRYEGVRSFLDSRGIALPQGTPGDPPGDESICALGNRKNALFLERLSQDGVQRYEPAAALVRNARAAGFKIAVVSSSKNCQAVLEAADLSEWFDVRADGNDIEAMSLQGKPNPDLFLEAAKRLSASPERCVVIEDSNAGVQAGRRGGFGYVIGLARRNNRDALLAHGAHQAVESLESLHIDRSGDPSHGTPLPSALTRLTEITAPVDDRTFAVFLDYDGTLTPIVSRPELATLSPKMRDTVRALAQRCTVAIVSGRDLADVRKLVGLDMVYFAGSHGFDIAGPNGTHIEHQHGKQFLPELDRAERALRASLSSISGCQVERKRFSIAVHYRRVEPAMHSTIGECVRKVAADHPSLRYSTGKMIHELQPGIDWDKGKAVLWILNALGLDGHPVVPVYLGDDVTDEDAFRVLQNTGAGILITEKPTSNTSARYMLRDTDEVQQFLQGLVHALEARQ